jgi:hypothetical protein
VIELADRLSLRVGEPPHQQSAAEFRAADIAEVAAGGDRLLQIDQLDTLASASPDGPEIPDELQDRFEEVVPQRDPTAC